MKLDEAIRKTFGRSGYVRREAWPNGSAGVINYVSDNKFKPFWCTFGNVPVVVPPNGDLDAEDWYPCTLGAAPVTEDWRDALSIKRGDEIRSIGRGDKCEVTLDGRTLQGDCTLAWAVPD